MRLTLPTIRTVGRTIRFSFDGMPIEALEGETIAAALSAAGVVTFRHTPSGAPRGLHCGMGACFDCVVTVDGRIGQRACMTLAAEGQRVTGALPDRLTTTDETPPQQERTCDILVVGGGVAGLAAAAAAASSGASVILLDERAIPGGQYGKWVAHSLEATAPDRQFATGIRLRQAARDAGVAIETGALAWGAFAPDQIAALVRGQSVLYHPRRLILATGAHEAPVPLPGWTLPGVLTTGGLQALARAQMVLPGRRLLLAGNGPLNLQVACEMVARGIPPVAVLEAAPKPGQAALGMVLRMARAAPDLAWDGARMLHTLHRAGVPVLWGTVLDRLDGDGRVQAAHAGGQAFAVDLVALNRGFQAETGLARALGVPHRRGPGGTLETEADDDGRTAVAGVFAVGNGARFGGARVAEAAGRLAGLTAAAELGCHVRKADAAPLRRARRFQNALWRLFAAPEPPPIADETIVCRCEEISAGHLRARMAAGLTSLPALKKATRAGMGRCQGRFCAASVARLLGGDLDAEDFAAPRAPLRPVPAAPLMHPAPEFVAPLLEAPSTPRRLHRLPAMPVAERSADVVVIGGGVAGLSTAYFLARDGADVLLVDRDEIAMAASTANAGSLHVQLLSYDFTDGIEEDGGPAAHTLPLAPRSIALWKEIGTAVGDDLGIRTEGGLMLAEDAAGMDWLRRKSAMERRWGIESHVLGRNEVRALAPALSEHMLGADFVPAEGYGDPLRGMSALLALVQRHGARLLRGAEVEAIGRAGTTWRVATSKGPITAGRVVNAAGPWAAVIGRMVGLSLPVTGTVQQVIVTESAPPSTRHLVAVANRHLSLKQQASGGFLVGGGWFGAFNPASGRSHPLRENIQGNLWVAAQALPLLRSLAMVRSWTGINPAIDRAPLLGEAPGLPGFFNTVTANGYTLGPVVGEITAAAIRHGEPVNPHYRLERFR
ncbi:FAD-dependent oxidoreductase [Rhodopila sp.]|jgi:glycine/D-amino acid oxidase-like deaminating enzyme|uniref:FAD-dependent oxidoreductase n=1 Tax=Rhodopila sp. TaxID=2480087 RepID=UPI002C5C4C4A|nr:FAD-dependent oxidoreductase [Rhodopila sp.]HVZ09278.1 FAD-dependent oxidoreductase [Rhodopila sp.]